MAARNEHVRSLAARKAIATRYGRDTSELDRELRYARLAEHVRSISDAAPALTAEDAERLRALLPQPARGREAA